jgi:hypothetical protein
VQFSDINRNPSSRTLREFAALWILFFGGTAVLKHLPVFGAVAVAIGLAGLVWPRLMRPVFVGWMIAAFPIGWLVSHVLLGVLFVAVFVPIGLIFRLTGRDPLRLKKVARETYWTEKLAPTDSSQYFRQY